VRTAVAATVPSLITLFIPFRDFLP
jgi:hypothetical protein